MEPSSPTNPRWRRVLVPALVVLGCLLAPIAVDAVWVKGTALDTDRFVAQLAPLASDPHVREAAADAVSRNLLRGIDLRARLTSVLPDNLTFLAAPLDTTLSSYVHRVSLAAVSSTEFANIWTHALRISHRQVVTALTGGGRYLGVANGVVTLDLTQVRATVAARLDRAGLSRFVHVDMSRPVTVTLLESESLKRAQVFVRLLRTLGWLVPVLAALPFAAAVLLSRRRRRTVMWAGAGLAVAMAVHLGALALGQSLYLTEVTKVLPEAAANSIFDLLVRAPRSGTRWLLALGLVVTLGTVLIGPSTGAVRLRSILGRSEREPGEVDGESVT